MDATTGLRPWELGILPLREDCRSPPRSHFPLINPALEQEKPKKGNDGAHKKDNGSEEDGPPNVRNSNPTKSVKAGSQPATP